METEEGRKRYPLAWVPSENLYLNGKRKLEIEEKTPEWKFTLAEAKEKMGYQQSESNKVCQIKNGEQLLCPLATLWQKPLVW